jgi:hypothetical protein
VRIKYKFLVQIYVLPEMELRRLLLFPKQNYNFLSPSFQIHVSVSDLLICKIGLPTYVAAAKKADQSWDV